MGRDLSNFRNTRALGGVEPDASISLRPLSISLFSLAPYFPLWQPPFSLPPRFDTLSRTFPVFSITVFLWSPARAAVRYPPMIPDFSISRLLGSKGTFPRFPNSKVFRDEEPSSKLKTTVRNDKLYCGNFKFFWKLTI